MNLSKVRKEDLFESFPSPWKTDLFEEIKAIVKAMERKVVVIDDDPTGVQTVHDVPIFTGWSKEELRSALSDNPTTVYLLTNSRSFPLAQAEEINREIGENLAAVMKELRLDIEVISRSDSTLRGHYPGEVNSLRKSLEDNLVIKFDAEIVIPFFMEGGRFTANNIHWVEEGKWLIPVHKTEFAKDQVFGYQHSNLSEWIEEKTQGKHKVKDVISVTLNDLRLKGPLRVEKILEDLKGEKKVIVNSLTYRDMEVFVLGLLKAEEKGKRFIFRTAASFVKVRGAIEDIPLLSPEQIYQNKDTGKGNGIIAVGSYMKMSTDQLNEALKLERVKGIELKVKNLFHQKSREEEIGSALAKAEQTFNSGKHVLVYTSRKEIRSSSDKEKLKIGRMVSNALVEVLKRVQTEPSFVIAKGGITASDIATRALGIRKALVKGQLEPGIPVWIPGDESRFPLVPYVVFPGNVGQKDSLARIIEKLEKN